MIEEITEVEDVNIDDAITMLCNDLDKIDDMHEVKDDWKANSLVKRVRALLENPELRGVKDVFTPAELGRLARAYRNALRRTFVTETVRNAFADSGMDVEGELLEAAKNYVGTVGGASQQGLTYPPGVRSGGQIASANQVATTAAQALNEEMRRQYEQRKLEMMARHAEAQNNYNGAYSGLLQNASISNKNFWGG